MLRFVNTFVVSVSCYKDCFTRCEIHILKYTRSPYFRWSWGGSNPIHISRKGLSSIMRLLLENWRGFRDTNRPKDVLTYIKLIKIKLGYSMSTRNALG